jgi:hypothetical protein
LIAGICALDPLARYEAGSRIAIYGIRSAKCARLSLGTKLRAVKLIRRWFRKERFPAEQECQPLAWVPLAPITFLLGKLLRQ